MARIRLKGSTHWVVGAKRVPGKGSREVRLLCLGPHESVGAAISAWEREFAVYRGEAARLEREMDAVASNLGISPEALRRGEVRDPAARDCFREVARRAERLVEHAQETADKVVAARRLPPVTPCSCGGGSRARRQTAMPSPPENDAMLGAGVMLERGRELIESRKRPPS